MKVKYCKSCNEKIVFLKTKNNKYIPVNWKSLLMQDKRNYLENVKVIFNPDRGHISHFATCPNSSKFRKK